MGLQGTDSGCHFRSSKHYFRYTFALRRARQALDRQLKAKISFRGRRQWPQAISYPPTPSSVWGRGEKRGRASRRSVKRGFQEEKGGRGAGVQKRHLRHRGVRRGVCNPLQPARSPALSEGLGGPGLDHGAPQGSQESFRDSKEPISGAIFDTRSPTFGTPWLLGELDKPRLPQS